MTPSIDQTLHLFANLLPNLTLIPIVALLPNFGGFYRTLQRVRIANRGRLLLRTPGPVPFGTCIVLMLRPYFPELVMSTDLLSFEYPSVLLFCFVILYNEFVLHKENKPGTKLRCWTLYIHTCIITWGSLVTIWKLVEGNGALILW